MLVCCGRSRRHRRHMCFYDSRRVNETRNDEAAHYVLVFCHAKSVRSSVTKETESIYPVDRKILVVLISGVYSDFMCFQIVNLKSNFCLSFI
jgi:hypothetical protein